MLFNSRNKAIVSRVLLTSWLAMLAGCNNGNAIEGLIGPDPQLKAKVVREDSPQFANSQVNAGEVEDRVEDNTSPLETEAPGTEDNTSPLETEVPGTENSETSLSESQPEPELPTDFPSFVPIYPQAKLQGAIPGAAINQGRAYWRSPDSARQIVTYYQQQLSAEGWELIQPFELNTQSNNQEAIAIKDNLQITIKVPQSASKEESGLFLLSYQPVTPDTPAEVETPATIEEIETEKNNNSVAERKKFTHIR